jgi:hypothetical protein
MTFQRVEALSAYFNGIIGKRAVFEDNQKGKESTH